MEMDYSIRSGFSVVVWSGSSESKPSADWEMESRFVGQQKTIMGFKRRKRGWELRTTVF